MQDTSTNSPEPARKLPEKFLVAFSFAGEQRVLVREIAAAVERRIGPSSVFLDEWFEHVIAGHDGDLKLQKIYGEQSELIVVCVSERYGGKPWTRAEHEAIRARLMKSRESANDCAQFAVLPIRVGDGDVEGIFFNTIVPDVRDRPADGSAQLIVDRLRLIIPDLGMTNRVPPQAPAWPKISTPLVWPIADHREVREAFLRLLDPQAPWRFLPIRGTSETGKSHITRQMLANALRTPDLACGRFDFKGTTTMEPELRAFVQDLGVPVPAAGRQLIDRLGDILSELKRRARPAFIVFDTYEAAGEATEWVEKQLLSSLIRADWLRVAIAGQRVPDRTAAVWESIASPTLELSVPPPADWFEHGKQYRAGLTLADVETACRLASNRASLLAQLLGPVT